MDKKSSSMNASLDRSYRSSGEPSPVAVHHPNPIIPINPMTADSFKFGSKKTKTKAWHQHGNMPATASDVLEFEETKQEDRKRGKDSESEDDDSSDSSDDQESDPEKEDVVLDPFKLSLVEELDGESDEESRAQSKMQFASDDVVLQR